MVTRHVAVWSVPDDPDGFRPLDTPDVTSFNCTESAESIGGGGMGLPADYKYADLLLSSDPVDPSNSRAALIRVYRDDATDELPDVEFFTEEAVETVGEPGELSVELRDIKIGLDDGIIGEEMVWGGTSPLPPFGWEDLASIKAQYEIYLERERYRLTVTASGGTYTLSVNNQTTSNINASASSTTIRERLEALSGISSVAVTRESPGVFDIVFLNPTQVSPNLSVNTGSLTGGTANVTQEATGFDSSGASFTVEVTTSEGVDTTDPLPWNVSARNFEGWGFPGLQGLSNVQDVTVTGTGVYGDPWTVTFYNPPIAQITNVSFAAGTAVLTEVQPGVLDPSPITISKPADQQAGDPVDHGNYGNPPLEVVTDIVAPGSHYSIKVNALTQFAGQQVVVDVEPGEEYNGARIRVNSEGGGRHAFVVRTVFGDLIRRQEFDVDADTWTWLTVPDFIAPPGAPQIIIRVACVEADPDDVSPFRADWEGAELWSGRPPATAGSYVLEALESIQQRGSLTWVEPGFTVTEDANEDPWDDPALPFRADRGQSFGTHFLGDLARMGYPYDLRPKQAPPGGFPPGAATHTLLLFNPFSRTSGIQVKQGFVAGALRPGSKFARRRVQRTHVLVETDDGETKWVTDGRLAGLPRRESFARAEYVNEQGADLVGAAILDDDIKNLFAVQVQLADGVEPYRDFDIGDMVPVVSGRVSNHDRAVWSVSLRLNSDGSWTSEVTASRLYKDALTRTYEAVRRLYDEFNRRRGRGGGRTLTALPAPGPAASTGAHIHLVAAAQEVSGSLVEWAGLNPTHPPETFPVHTFPTEWVTVQEPGYYDIAPWLIWDADDGAAVELRRRRGGVETTVWPAVDGQWVSEYGSEFGATAGGVELESGDEVAVRVASGVGLVSGSLMLELVDRVRVRPTAAPVSGDWELVFAVNDRFGITWDGTNWWLSRAGSNLDAVFFKYDSSWTQVDAVGSSGFNRTNRGIIFHDGYLWSSYRGALSDSGNRVVKRDPVDGSAVLSGPSIGASQLRDITRKGDQFVAYRDPETNGLLTFFDETTLAAVVHQPVSSYVYGIEWDGVSSWYASHKHPLSSAKLRTYNESFDTVISEIAAPELMTGLELVSGFLYGVGPSGVWRIPV